MKKFLPALAAVLLAVCAAEAALSPVFVAEIRGVASLDSTAAAVAAACGLPAPSSPTQCVDFFRATLFDAEGVLDVNRSVRFALLAEDDGSGALGVVKLPASDSSVYLAELLEKVPEAADADLTAFPSGARAFANPWKPGKAFFVVPRDDDMLLVFPGDACDLPLDFPAIASALVGIPPVLPVPGLVAASCFELDRLFALDEVAAVAAIDFDFDEEAFEGIESVSWGLAFDAGVASLNARVVPEADSPFAATLAGLAPPSDEIARAFRFPEALFALADGSAPAATEGGAFPALSVSGGLDGPLARLADENLLSGESAAALLPPGKDNLLRAVACQRLEDAASFRERTESFLARAIAEDGNPHGLAVEHVAFGETPVTRVTMASPLFPGCPSELLLAWAGDRVILSTAGEAACTRALTLLEFPSPAAPSLRESEAFAALFPEAPETLLSTGVGDLGDLAAAYLPFLPAVKGAAPTSCRAGYCVHADGADVLASFRVEAAGLPALADIAMQLFATETVSFVALEEPEAVPEEAGDAEEEAEESAPADPAFADGDVEPAPSEAAAAAEAVFEAEQKAAREAAEIPERAVPR